MENKTLYILAEFDENTQNILSGYYKILENNAFVGTQTKNIPYHFTLGCMSLENEGILTQAIDKFCSKNKTIDIRLDHIGLFGMNVLFIEPNVNFELLSLQNYFFNNDGKGYHSWSPHASVLIDNPVNVLKALPILSENFKPIHAKIEKVSLYEFFPTRFIKSSNLLD